MPKMKTHRGAAKRFSVTGSGKVKFKKAGLRHILTGKPKGRKTKLGKPGMLNLTQSNIIKAILPYA